MSKQVETAQLIASDLHYGKSTHSYGPDIFRDRLNKLSERMARIRELKQGYDFDGLIVNLLGDVNDGSDIYPGQANYQANSDVRSQAKEFAELFSAFLRKQSETWGPVRVECVPGNHGRAGKSVHEAANWDLVAYDYLQAELKPHIPVHFNDSGDVFVRVSEVKGHRYLLYHGHGVRCYQGIPWYGIQQRLLRWHNSSFGPFDVAFLGHFHSCQEVTINQFEAYLTGTMVTDDEWALRELGQESPPKWWLLGASDHYPVTWQYKLVLN